MGRSPCCDKVGLKKGPWTPEEDQKLLAFIEENGHGSWRALPAKAGLQRCGKSCRLRWTNYLRPDIKRGKFSLQEEQTIIQLHALLGNRWSAIATHLPKRTDNEIKNYWNTHLKKRLAKMGIDPVTHKPKNDALLTNEGQSKNAANLSHMAQWESARLEAESRLARQSKLRSPKPMAPTAGPSRWNGADHDSPTSTLTCAEHVAAQISTTNGMGENPAALIGNSLGLHDLAVTPCADTAAWTTEDNTVKAADTVEHIPTGNFVETFTDLLLSTASADRGGPTDSINGSYYEENKNYWSSILNLVNSSPSDSPLL